MGFEDYSVLVCAKPGSPLYSGNTEQTLCDLASELQQAWPQLHSDDVQIACLEYPKPRHEVFLAYETDTELFQVLIHLDTRTQNNIVYSLRFAYCNPRSIYEPFCAVIEWLMQRYGLYCSVGRVLAPEQKGMCREIDDVEDLRATLIPSMDYNRGFWQMDAQTDAEAALRPGEAIARFIAPMFINSIA